MIKEIRELIATYLIRFTFWILPNGELKNSYAKFSYDLMVDDLSRVLKMNAKIKPNNNDVMQDCIDQIEASDFEVGKCYDIDFNEITK